MPRPSRSSRSPGASRRTPADSSKTPAALPQCGAAEMTRVVWVHESINRGERVNSVTFAAQFGRCDRTFYRTIETMKDLGMKVKYSHDHKGYIYLEPSPFLPTVLLTADEALALTMAKQTFAAWAGTPLENLLDAAFQKFARASAGNITFSSQSVITTPAAMVNATEQRTLAAVFTALLQNRELRLRYQKPNSQTVEERVVWPLHLNWPDHSWIVLVHDVKKNAIRTLRLSRIKSIAFTEKTFTRPKDFDAAEHLRGSMGAYTGDEDHEVQIRLMGFSAAQARDHRWHASQKLTELAHDQVEITLRLNNLVDVEHAILRCGPEAIALSPPALRTNVRHSLTAALAHYDGVE